MPKVLVFDIGNVLLHWNPDILFAKLIPDNGARAAFFRDILPPEWNIEQDRGRSWAEAEAERIAQFPDQAPLIRAFRARWHEMISGAIAGTVALLEALLVALPVAQRRACLVEPVGDPLQLAIYRVAYAELVGVPVDQVDAAFLFVRDGAVVRPDGLPDRNGLESLLAGG